MWHVETGDVGDDRPNPIPLLALVIEPPLLWLLRIDGGWRCRM
jgi:hypothetical protein